MTGPFEKQGPDSLDDLEAELQRELEEEQLRIPRPEPTQPA